MNHRNIYTSDKSKIYGYSSMYDIKHFDKYSINFQNEHITNYCTDHNLNLSKIFSDFIHKDELGKLMKMIQPGDIIIVDDVSRISRDEITLLKFHKDLTKRRGCIIICLSPYINTIEEMGEFMMNMMILLVAHETDILSKRTKNPFLE